MLSFDGMAFLFLGRGDGKGVRPPLFLGREDGKGVRPPDGLLLNFLTRPQWLSHVPRSGKSIGGLFERCFVLEGIVDDFLSNEGRSITVKSVSK